MKENLPANPNETGAGKVSKIKKIIKRAGIASVVGATLTSGALAEQKPSGDNPFEKESRSKVTREYKPPKVVLGDKYVGLADLDNVFVLDETRGQDVSAVTQHNLKKPESLADIGKILLEPVSISVSFPYGKDNLIATVRTMLGYEADKTQIIDIEIPYRHAQNFDTADPKDREKMEKQAMEDAEELFKKISTDVLGLSFFKKEAEKSHREFSAPITQVSSMNVEGFASPETSEGVNFGDIRNQKLSKLRAENAAEIIAQLFKERNIGVDSISFQGKGEEFFSSEELKKLADEAVSLNLSSSADLQNNKALKIITEYNAGNITNESAIKILKEIVGSKRKVAIHLEIDEEKKILVLPIPLFLLLIPLIARIRERISQSKIR